MFSFVWRVFFSLKHLSTTLIDCETMCFLQNILKVKRQRKTKREP